MSVLINDGTAELQAWRANARVWKLAWRRALRMVPNPAGGTMLDLFDTVSTSPETPIELREMMVYANELIRSHPDVAEWAPGLVGIAAPGLSGPNVDLVIDGFFRLAMAIEAGDGAARDAAHAQLMAMLGAAA